MAALMIAKREGRDRLVIDDAPQRPGVDLNPDLDGAPEPWHGLEATGTTAGLDSPTV